jgi:hypothetical protein
MKNLYFTDSTQFYAYLERYHAGKNRMVAVTESPVCSVASGSAVHLSNKPNSTYKVTVYEGRITGKLRRVIRVMEVDQGLYRILGYHIDIASGFYFGQLDRLVNTLTTRKRKLITLLNVITSV